MVSISKFYSKKLGCVTSSQIDEEVPEYFKNFDLNSLVTLIKVDRLEAKLKESGYPTEKTDYLIQGFRHGFSLGYAGPTNRQDESQNIPLKVGSKVILWNKLMKEVKLGIVAGPYKTIPFDNYMQSPIGLVPKDRTKTRLIFHLSYQFTSGLGSLNSNTPAELCYVKYRDLDHAMRTCLKLLEKAQMLTAETPTIYFGKTDVQSAFHLVIKSVGW